MQKPNHLASEKSPYLQEHVLNPVDWYSWSDEAKEKAKNDGKPILLSIGYSTCHWCHQMRKESFENQKTAAFINEHFIPIKVDREERPEVDAYYMGAVQAMTGSGGWPLTVFLTPDLKPFYGGTYFPPEPRYGMPSFMQVLEFVSKLWKERKDEVRSNTEQVLKSMSPEAGGRGEVPKEILDEGYAALISSFDEECGGFGRAPKFPVPGTLSFMLRYYYRTRKELAMRAVLKTLDRMMAGGIRDQVGGGFHRYSTDRVWLVPHFEKMLYDNALLARAYAEAFQLTGRQEYALVVRETLGWLRGEMRDKKGGFYSGQDADTSEGEGRYYTWTPEEIESALGDDDAKVFCRFYGVTKNGNFEGRNLLHLEPGLDPGEEEKETLARGRKVLYSDRVKRPRPATDTKVLTSWNGLAVSTFAYASCALGDEELLRDAVGAAEFILKTNVKGGRLLRRYAGGEAAIEGTLEDYAFFVQGLLDLFEASSEPRWLKESMRLTEVMVEDLEDKAVGGFYLSQFAEPARLKEAYDGPTPSGNSVAALNLVRMTALTGEERLRKAAEQTISCFSKELQLNPSGHTTMLSALDLLLNGAREVVITAPTEKAARGMKVEAVRGYIPDKVVIVATPATFAGLSGMSRLLEGRKPGARARAYVCQNFECKLPVDSAEALREQLSPRQGLVF
ncbi:MAG: thioredoxin domain-containing protein [Nitrososphaerota archaeon]|nr:thioredoxin domain-containing protein [Nitrososphaerota archaeon]